MYIAWAIIVWLIEQYIENYLDFVIFISRLDTIHADLSSKFVNQESWNFCSVYTWLMLKKLKRSEICIGRVLEYKLNTNATSMLYNK